MKVKNIVIIGSSAGGPRILKELFKDLPLLKGSIIVVQHMPKFVNESLTGSLDHLTAMSVRLAQNGDKLQSGTVYIAPSEVHLELVNNNEIKLFQGEKINYVCPSVDVTMKSIINEMNIQVIGVVLTGMGRDGADGIGHIKQNQGITIAQDEKSSIIFGMPKEAIQTGKVDWILNPDQIKFKLIELLGTIEKNS
jgi:two-component system chemotaxis response regulator CheB